MAAIYPVILAGGSGTRLWPLSRKNHPKQFTDPLDQGFSLLQSTVLRLRKVTDSKPLVIGNKEHRFLLEAQLDEVGLGVDDILLESHLKNTAVPVLLGALHAYNRAKDSIVLVLPSDHFISDERVFADTVRQCSTLITSSELVLLGVKPDKPNEQYGYLSLGGEVISDSQLTFLRDVHGFVEKPLIKQAQALIDSGEVFWNSGIVLASSAFIIELFSTYQPSLFDCIESAFKKRKNLYGFDLVDTSQAINISFDYAILENRAVMKRAGVLDLEWDDLGTWSALSNRRSKLGMGQMVFGNGKRKLFITDKDVVLVEADDLILVSDLASLSDMPRVSDYLFKSNLQSLENGMGINRPWGSFKVLAEGSGFLVKQLSIRPGKKISLQSHQFRVENWVVVSGVCLAAIDGEDVCLSSGESIRIGEGQVHRLENIGLELLVIIEVQTGSALSEGDIVRYDDDFNRHIEDSI